MRKNSFEEVKDMYAMSLIYLRNFLFRKRWLLARQGRGRGAH